MNFLCLGICLWNYKNYWENTWPYKYLLYKQILHCHSVHKQSPAILTHSLVFKVFEFIKLFMNTVMWFLGFSLRQSNPLDGMWYRLEWEIEMWWLFWNWMMSTWSTWGFMLLFCLVLHTCEVKWSEVTQSCPTLCDPMDCSPPGSSVHGILQARILEWAAIPSSRGSSWPRNWTWVSCIAGRFFTIWATAFCKQRKAKLQLPGAFWLNC